MAGVMSKPCDAPHANTPIGDGTWCSWCMYLGKDEEDD